MTGDDAMLTVPEAAELLGVSPDCVYRLARIGRIGHYRVGLKGGRILLRPRDVRRYLRSCRVESNVPKGMGNGRMLKHITV